MLERGVEVATVTLTQPTNLTLPNRSTILKTGHEQSQTLDELKHEATDPATDLAALLTQNPPWFPAPPIPDTKSDGLFPATSISA